MGVGYTWLTTLTISSYPGLTTLKNGWLMDLTTLAYSIEWLADGLDYSSEHDIDRLNYPCLPLDVML